MPDDRPVMWVNGQGLQLQVQSPAGPVYLQELYMVALMARAYGGEIIRFTYDSTDPETGETISGAGRIVYEELPDPRAEVQPAPPAGATAQECTPNCDGSDMCTGAERPKRVVQVGSPFPGFPSEAELADRIFGPGTAESLGTAARYIERPSGPPVRVDGPGCTPATVEACAKCKQPFDGDFTVDGHGKQKGMPFCVGCVSRCHDTEIADHWCVVDQWRSDNRKAPEGEA